MERGLFGSIRRGCTLVVHAHFKVAGRVPERQGPAWPVRSFLFGFC